MSAYQTMIDVLANAAEEPEEAAMQILEALRRMPAEVTEAGVDPLQWEKTCEAMLAAARVDDSVRRAGEADARREAWPEIRRRLEQVGCKVSNRDGDVWRVVGTGVSIEIDLVTGEVEHSDGEVGEQLPGFDRIAGFIVGSVARREIELADLARRNERRKTHRWDNKKKVWLPRSGVGPIILAGK